MKSIKTLRTLKSVSEGCDINFTDKKPRYLRISDDCPDGDLFFYGLTITNLITKESYTALVEKYITYVQPGTRPNSQTYACNLIGKTST